MAELLTSDAPAWSQFVKDFDGALRAFHANRQGLAAQLPYLQSKHPELIPQYREMLARADALAPKLQSLADTRAKVAGWLGTLGTVYQSAVDLTSRAIERVAGGVAAARKALGLGDLGIAPIIVVVGLGVAGATLAAVTKWIADAFLFAKRLSAMQDLEAKGYKADAAAAAVNDVMGKPGAAGGFERTLTNIAWIVGLAIVASIVLPNLLGNRNRSS